MKKKSQLRLTGLTMPGIIMIAFMATFISCKKTDIKSSTPQIESFAANHNATIVVPAAPGVQERQAGASEKYNTF